MISDPAGILSTIETNQYALWIIDSKISFIRLVLVKSAGDSLNDSSKSPPTFSALLPSFFTNNLFFNNDSII